MEVKLCVNVIPICSSKTLEPPNPPGWNRVGEPGAEGCAEHEHTSVGTTFSAGDPVDDACAATGMTMKDKHKAKVAAITRDARLRDRFMFPRDDPGY
jgi:hypothetical protein